MMANRRIIVIALFLTAFFLGAEPAMAQATEIAAKVAGSVLGGTLDVVGTILSPIGYAIMQLTSYIAMLGGVVLNASIYYTVILMSQNFGNMPAIGEAWGVIRDVANMGFIFVLLYASIMSIIGKESPARGLIVKMVIAAILVNFSLFFTKIVIDISNLLALTFYKALVPASTLTSDNFLSAGLSNAMIDALKVSSLWETPNLVGANLFITTILASVVLLITAFVFFAVAIMFITRYIVLIFVLILSPIAFVSQVLPGLDSIAKQWRSALVSQATFAPIYFLLTWVTIKMVTSISDVAFGSKSGFGAAFTASGSGSFDSGIASTLVNFAVIIGFLIISLIVAKSAAGKSDMGINKWLTAAAGGVTLGTVGRLGRNTIGMAGSTMADSEYLKKKEQEGGMKGAMARLGLAAGRKSAKATFDARGSSLYESVSGATGVSMGKPIGKGGFEQKVKDITKEQKAQADLLKPSDLVINKAEKELDEAKKYIGPDRAARIAAAQKKVDDLKGVNEDDAKKRKIAQIREASNWTISEKDARGKVGEREGLRLRKIKEMTDADPSLTQKQAEEKWEQELKDEIKSFQNGGMNEKAAINAAEEKWGNKLDTVKGEAAKRKEAYADRLLNPNLRDFGFIKGSWANKVLMTSKANKQAAMEIRKSIKDKKPADKLAEELSKAQQAGEDNAGTSTPTPTPTPSTPPPASGPATP